MREPAKRLAGLESELRALTSARNQTVAEATALIAKTNRDYDRRAVKLNREITRLRAMLFPEPDEQPTNGKREHKPLTTARRKPELHITEADGYTAEEVAHYHELLRRKADKQHA